MEETKLILLVEDHFLVGKGLKELIEKLTYKYKYAVHIAKDGEEAIEMAKANRYALILMDFYMPVMEGDEATKEIIKHNPDAKILGISGENDMDIIHKMIKAGAKGFITKNTKHEELTRCMDAVIDGAQECYSTDVRVIVDSYNDALKHPPLIEETKAYLTPLEIEVAKRRISLESNEDIAKDMHISKRTVETHFNDVAHKFNILNHPLLLLKRAKKHLIMMGIMKK